jgi:hypothetical protein
MTAGAPRPAAGPGPATGPVRPAGRRFLRVGSGAEWSRDHILLAVVAMTGVLLYLVALRLATGSLDPVWWALTLVPLLTWSLSGSTAPLILWTVLLIVWVNGTPAGNLSWWSVLAATGAALSHGATALSDSGPPARTVPAGLVRHWVRWAALGVGSAALVAVLATLLAGRIASLGPAAYVIGLAGLALGIWALRTNPPQTPE